VKERASREQVVRKRKVKKRPSEKSDEYAGVRFSDESDGDEEGLVPIEMATLTNRKDKKRRSEATRQSARASLGSYNSAAGDSEEDSDGDMEDPKEKLQLFDQNDEAQTDQNVAPDYGILS